LVEKNWGDKINENFFNLIGLASVKYPMRIHRNYPKFGVLTLKMLKHHLYKDFKDYAAPNLIHEYILQLNSGEPT